MSPCSFLVYFRELGEPLEQIWMVLLGSWGEREGECSITEAEILMLTKHSCSVMLDSTHTISLFCSTWNIGHKACPILLSTLCYKELALHSKKNTEKQGWKNSKPNAERIQPTLNIPFPDYHTRPRLCYPSRELLFLFCRKESSMQIAQGISPK